MYEQIENGCTYHLFVDPLLQGFFRRIAKEKGNKQYRCSKSQNCEVTTGTRNLCRACRYQKCLDIGMSIEGKSIFYLLCFILANRWCSEHFCNPWLLGLVNYTAPGVKCLIDHHLCHSKHLRIFKWKDCYSCDPFLVAWPHVFLRSILRWCIFYDYVNVEVNL